MKKSIKEQLEDMVTFLNTYFDQIHRSPYSQSCYNMDVDWNRKPIGVIRVSDHWNFKTPRDRKIHCKTKRSPKGEHLSVAIYDGELFNVLYSLPLANRDYTNNRANYERFYAHGLWYSSTENKFYSTINRYEDFPTQEHESDWLLGVIWGDLIEEAISINKKDNRVNCRPKI